MGFLLTDRSGWLGRGVATALLTVGLVACGTAPEEGNEITPPPPLSPQAAEIPEDTFQATAKITDGGLDPDRFTGQIGSAFRLVITGDGKEHTLEIADLVADTAIKPTGETTVAFTISGDPGESDITLDGKKVGTFERQAAGGVNTQ